MIGFVLLSGSANGFSSFRLNIVKQSLLQKSFLKVHIPDENFKHHWTNMVKLP